LIAEIYRCLVDLNVGSEASCECTGQVHAIELKDKETEEEEWEDCHIDPRRNISYISTKIRDMIFTFDELGPLLESPFHHCFGLCHLVLYPSSKHPPFGADRRVPPSAQKA